MRQAFREQFILHRTETEETDYPGQGTGMLTSMHPHADAAEEGKRHAGPHLRTKQRPLFLGPTRTIWLLGAFPATTVPTPLPPYNSWSRSILLLPMSAKTPALSPKVLTQELGIKWQVQA